MRTLAVYVLALAAAAAALVFAFPELWGSADAAGKGGGRQRVTPAVIVVEVRRAPFEDSLQALGTVHANESVEITPNRADHIAKLHFSDGQTVAIDTLLVELQSEQEHALLAEAMAVRDERKLSQERTLDLTKRGMSSQRELETAQALLSAAQARVISLDAAIADHAVHAPFAGTLGLRRVSVGAYVQPSTVITTLDDLSIVKVDFTIPEAWLPAIAAGMRIAARNEAWPDDEFAGEITTVDTRLDERTRSATVRAVIPNPQTRLRPGMLVKVRVERDGDDVLQVPEEALIPFGHEQFVLRVGDDGVAHRVPVQIGRRRVGAVEILEGLRVGERVVVEGIRPDLDDAKVVVVDTRGQGD